MRIEFYEMDDVGESVESRFFETLKDLRISPSSNDQNFLQKPKENQITQKNILHNTTILRTYNQIISVKQSLLTLVYSVQTFRGFFDSFLRLDGAFNDASLAERADFRFLLRVWRLRVRRGWRVGG